MSGSQSTGEAGAVPFADQMRLKHVDIHSPTVEDVVDEDDLQHPPPTFQSQPTDPVVAPAEQPLSEKALGKQKAQDDGGQAQRPTAAGPQSRLDTNSEELFPALGGGPKPRASGAASAWGGKKPSSLVNGSVNGGGGTPSARSSRSATPASGVLAHGLTDASSGFPQTVFLPGKHTQTVSFDRRQIAGPDQLKKPIPDILREISKKSRGVVVTQKPSPSGSIVFEGKGPADAVQKALRDLAREIGSKQAVKVPIPASVRPHVIGRQGAIIRAIQERTGANVRVPKTEEDSRTMEDDDSATVDVIIEGDAVAAEMARQEIEAIVNERTSSINVRLKDIPAELYPFIAGPHNAGVNALRQGHDVQIKVPTYHSWSHQPPPQAMTHNGPVQFVPHPTSHIQLSGERRAVQEIRAQIERQAEQLRRQITLAELSVPRGQHQFIVGDGGNDLHNLLAETGCAVILPPGSEDSEVLVISGPPDKIELGMDKVMNLAASMNMQAVDIARQHSNAPLGAQTHARNVTRYLQEREAITQLEKLFDSRIVLPLGDAPMTWEVYSREGRNGLRARSDILNVVNAHPPSRFMQVNVDPFYHQHLREQHAQRIRKEHGVHLLLPEGLDESAPVVLVYENPEAQAGDFVIPRQRPSPTEVAAFEKALRGVQAEIASLSTGQGPIGSRVLEVPPRFQDKVHKFVQHDQRDLPTGSLPLQVLLNGGNAVARAPDQPQLSVRGPEDRIDSLAERIAAFIEAEQRDELERGFTMSFAFPQKYANYLIGRRGENINKLREEFDVDIQVGEGKVELKGPKAKAEAAKSRILAMAKKLEDEATHVLKVKPQYHRELIGAKGSQVNRLQDRYNVRIQFPRSTQSGRDDESAVDGSEAGGHKNSRTNQAPDEVIVRGPKKGADEARDELLSLLQYTVDNSHSTSVSVAQSQLPSLIGQGGREMESIREQTGAKIDVPGSRDAAETSGRVELKIKGTKKQVEDAKRLLEQRAKIFDDSITRNIEVDKKYHKALIGSGGANLRNIVVQAGGSDDRRELSRTVRFPRAESDESTIRVEGNKAIVEKILSAIKAFVDERENQVTEILEVAPEKHRLLIGHGGEIRRNIESRFGIGLDIPKQSVQGATRSHIKLTGPVEKIAPAREHILALVKEQAGETVQVPRNLHHVISDNGQFFRRLKHDHKVNVEHAGQRPPSKPSSTPRARVNGGGTTLPLITDEQDSRSAENYSWEVVDSGAVGEDGEIPWVLRGTPENVAKARGVLERALGQARQHSSAGYLILPDPRTYRFVIGPGGSQINAIRKQTGCKITVPKDQARGEAIEVLGSKEGVEEAKDLILETVQRGSR